MNKSHFLIDFLRTFVYNVIRKDFRPVVHKPQLAGSLFVYILPIGKMDISHLL